MSKSSIQIIASSNKPKVFILILSKITKPDIQYKKDSNIGNKLKQVFDILLSSKRKDKNRNTIISMHGNNRGIKPKNPDMYNRGEKDFERFIF